MLKTFSCVIGALCLAGAAHAGGYTAPAVETAPAPVVMAPVAPVYSWAGAYVGGNVNYGSGKLKPAGELATFGLGDFAKPDGVSAALRAGYDWQFGKIVAGLGGEYNFGQYKDGVSAAYLGDLPSVDAKIKQVGTVFGRVGYAFNDQWMGYGLLGYSWGKVKFSGSGVSESYNLDGMTYGLGLAYAINQNWSAYGEYTFTDFGKVSGTEGNLKADLQQIKLGVNYRF